LLRSLLEFCLCSSMPIGERAFMASFSVVRSGRFLARPFVSGGSYGNDVAARPESLRPGRAGR
jgi:hypothetical protein